MDVVLTTVTNKGILECKRPNVVSGNITDNIYSNLELIIKKFRENNKLTQEWKDMYPKRFGQIEIANGAFPNLNTAEEFVNAVKNRGIVGVGDGKMFTISELKKSGRIAYFSKWQKNNN